MTEPTYDEVFPTNVSRAIEKKLRGVKAYASNYPQGQDVPVIWASPDMEVRTASYPGIYLAYAGAEVAHDREHRGRTALPYAPPGFAPDVLVPADFEDKDSDEWIPWNEAGFDRLTSPYVVWDAPIPYNLDFAISVLTRNYQQAFQIITQLQKHPYLPPRFGYVEVPEDGTVRTLDLLSGPDTTAIRDEDGKRVIQTVYSVRVTAELLVLDVEQQKRVDAVDLQLDAQYL